MTIMTKTPLGKNLTTLRTLLHSLSPQHLNLQTSTKPFEQFGEMVECPFTK